jgi:hypothetical protein
MSTVEAAQQLGISRWTLDVMVARAPKDLPDTPTHIGEGKERRNLWWDGVRLHGETTRGRKP